MLPQVTVEGRVVNDPELRFGPSGIAIGSFRLVASSRKKNEQDEWVDDRVLWLAVTCFRQLAENVAESLRKGDLVVVTGRLQTEEWETNEGEKRSRTELVANGVGASLQFRTIPHSEKRAERVAASDAPAENDPWAAPPAADEPPF